MISISTNFYPYRMEISSKKPVELSVNIKNASKETKLLSMDLVLQRSLSLNKSGANKSDSVKMGEVKPGEIKSFVFDVYPFQGIKPGMHKLKVRVNEHYNSYSHLSEKTEKIIQLRAV